MPSSRFSSVARVCQSQPIDTSPSRSSDWLCAPVSQVRIASLMVANLAIARSTSSGYSLSNGTPSAISAISSMAWLSLRIMRLPGIFFRSKKSDMVGAAVTRRVSQAITPC